jgi:hypothetical protein
VYYYRYLSNEIKEIIPKIFLLVTILIILFTNELYNCKTMLGIYEFPYHVIIEFIGLLLFYYIGSILSNL